jgi:hypothetical protein
LITPFRQFPKPLDSGIVFSRLGTPESRLDDFAILFHPQWDGTKTTPIDTLRGFNASGRILKRHRETLGKHFAEYRLGLGHELATAH